MRPLIQIVAPCFDTAETGRFSESWAVEAVVETLHDGVCVGRRGIFAGRRMDLGASTPLRVDDMRITVNPHRQQMLDPVFFEMFGMDIAAARSMVVKPQGHFRAAFDLWFPPEGILQVDVPGLNMPVLSRFGHRRYPRPIFPLDLDMQWALP